MFTAESREKYAMETAEVMQRVLHKDACVLPPSAHDSDPGKVGAKAPWKGVRVLVCHWGQSEVR